MVSNLPLPTNYSSILSNIYSHKNEREEKIIFISEFIRQLFTQIENITHIKCYANYLLFSGQECFQLFHTSRNIFPHKMNLINISFCYRLSVVEGTIAIGMVLLTNEAKDSSIVHLTQSSVGGCCSLLF